jgi:hypothetical protein
MKFETNALLFSQNQVKKQLRNLTIICGLALADKISG